MMPVLETPQKDCIFELNRSHEFAEKAVTWDDWTEPFLPSHLLHSWPKRPKSVLPSPLPLSVGGWRDQGTSDTTSLSMHEITWNRAWQPGVTQIFNKTMNYLKSNGICWIQYINWMSKTNKLGPDRNTRHKCLPASAHCSKPAVGIGQRPFHSQT